MYKMLDAPLAVHIELTPECNQGCSHCYNFWRGGDSKLEINDTNMDLETIEKVVYELSTFRVFHAINTGGEPLLNFKNLLFLMRKLKECGISFSLNTNASLLSFEKAKELRDAELRSVLVSLFSSRKEIHNRLANAKNFDKTVNGITNAIKAGLDVSINMVVTTENFNYVMETASFVKDLGVNKFSVIRVVEPFGNKRKFNKNLLLGYSEALRVVSDLLRISFCLGMKVDSLIPYPACFLNDEAVELLGNRSCSAGKTSAVISASGIVRACPHIEGSYGNLLKESLGDIWEKMTDWRNGKYIPKECKDCSLFSSCGGGCRAASCNHLIDGKDFLMNKIEETLLKKKFVKKIPLLNFQKTSLCVKRNCRFRKDKVFGIVNLGGIRNVFFDHQTFDLLFKLYNEKKVFSPAVLKAENDVQMDKRDFLFFLSNLVSRGVLEKIS